MNKKRNLSSETVTYLRDLLSKKYSHEVINYRFTIEDESVLENISKDKMPTLSSKEFLFRYMDTLYVSDDPIEALYDMLWFVFGISGNNVVLTQCDINGENKDICIVVIPHWILKGVVGELSTYMRRYKYYRLGNRYVVDDNKCNDFLVFERKESNEV